MKKPSGLGRGLSALIDDATLRPSSDKAKVSTSGGGVAEVEIGLIRPNPNQPRTNFDEAALAELAASVRQRGVLQPILLRVVGNGYEIIAGERRWRAAQLARLHKIPAVVRELDDAATAEIALIENIQREDLNAIEEAEAYRQLVATYAHTQEEVAQLVGKSRSHVTNLLRLLDLPDEVRQLLLRGDISMGHARAVIGAGDPVALAKQIVSEGLSVRQAERLARGAKPESAAAAKPSDRQRPVDADLAALERQLGDLLGLKVKVSHSGAGGAVTLNYSSLDQLDMICQRLSGEPI